MIRTDRQNGRSGRLVVVALVAAVALALQAVRLAAAEQDGALDDLDLLGLLILVYPAVPALVCPAVGCWLWLRRPTSVTGPLLVGVGVCYGLLGTFDLDVPIAWLGFVVGVNLLRPFEIALLTTYPTGHAGRAGGRLTVVAFAWAGVAMTATLLLGTAEHNPAGWVDAPLLAVAFREFTWRVVLPLILTTLAVLLLRRYRRFPPRARRSVGLVLVAGIALAVQDVVLLATWWLGDVVDGDTWGDVVWLSLPFLLPAAVAAAIVVAERRVAGAVSGDRRIVAMDDLVVPSRLEALLARNLGDPTATVLFRRDHGWIDTNGQPASLPEPGHARGVSPVDLHGTIVAAIVHDPALDAHPALVEAAAASAALALEYERLHALADAALAHQRESRAQLLAAQDRARRLIERDLHDGAQQRLVALALHARLLEASAGDPTHLRAACAEMGDGIDRTLGDIGALLAGLPPVALATEGLPGALRELANSGSIPVEFVGDVDADLPVEVAEAAWFVASEAVANATKHAAATTITVRAESMVGGILVEVVDDGRGGARRDGHGLAGLRQRVEAIGARLELDSPSGGGTAVRAWFPVEVPVR